jgi:hypothetical protein
MPALQFLALPLSVPLPLPQLHKLFPRIPWIPSKNPTESRLERDQGFFPLTAVGLRVRSGIACPICQTRTSHRCLVESQSWPLRMIPLPPLAVTHHCRFRPPHGRRLGIAKIGFLGIRESQTVSKPPWIDPPPPRRFCGSFPDSHFRVLHPLLLKSRRPFALNKSPARQQPTNSPPGATTQRSVRRGFFSATAVAAARPFIQASPRPIASWAVHPRPSGPTSYFDLSNFSRLVSFSIRPLC